MVSGNEFHISTVLLPYEDFRGIVEYETMITKNDEWLDYQERCDTLNEAKEQHELTVRLVKQKLI